MLHFKYKCDIFFLYKKGGRNLKKNNTLKTPEQLRAETGKTQIHFAEENLGMSYRSYQLRLNGRLDYNLKDLRILCELGKGSVLVEIDKKPYKISISEI